MAAFAAHPAQATDPIFGLTYDPASISFEAAPPDLASTCPDLTNQKWDRKMWVFGKIVDSGSQFLVIGGYYITRADATIQPDAPGAILRIDGDHCTLIGPAREVFDASADGITDPQLSKLAADAVCRYTRAFGTKSKLLAAMRRQHVSLNSGQSPVLKQALLDSPETCPN